MRYSTALSKNVSILKSKFIWKGLLIYARQSHFIGKRIIFHDSLVIVTLDVVVPHSISQELYHTESIRT